MISVSKQGRVFRVPVDPIAMTPIPLASFDDEPIGAFMMTFNSEGELRAAFPGQEFKFLEAPAKPRLVVEPLTQEQRRQVDKVLPQGPTSAVAVAPSTGQVLPPVQPGDDARLLHAEEFLKRLEVAAQYAGKKYQKELEIKVLVVRELIAEVFKA